MCISFNSKTHKTRSPNSQKYVLLMKLSHACLMQFVWLHFYKYILYERFHLYYLKQTYAYKNLKFVHRFINLISKTRALNLRNILSISCECIDILTSPLCYCNLHIHTFPNSMIQRQTHLSTWYNVSII